MDELEINYEEWRKPKPAGISACIRVRNEAQFMGAAVRSIVSLVNEIVLAVQPSDDDTLMIANELAAQYQNVKVHYYPIVPDWIDTAGFYKKDPTQPGHLVHMSNWALSKCSYSWILKIEGDVIALPPLTQMLQRVRANMDKPHYYGLVILNVAGKDMDKVSWENPRNGGADEAIFPNNPDVVKFVRRSKWEVAEPRCNSTSLGWALMHMKRCKIGKETGWNGEHYVDFKRGFVEEALREYNRINPYPAVDNFPLGHPCLYTGEWKRFL